MPDSLTFLNGLIDLPWWGYVLVALGLTHITIASVTIFLHRAQAHRALELHPAVSHFFRFWLWLTTGMVTKEWVAIHRKHHAYSDKPGDPHSPVVFGIGKVFWEGSELYRAEALNADTLKKYGQGTPDDWLERHLYTGRSVHGVALMLILNLALFGPAGLSIWAVQMLWIPVTAAGVINGIGHWWGYRNYECADAATNISPWGILIGGEELHNNHHAFASSAKLSSKSWEFDIGWFYICLLEGVGLAQVRKLAPELTLVAGKPTADMDTLRAIIVARLHVLSGYARQVMAPVLREELARADASLRGLLKRARRHLNRDERRLDGEARQRLQAALEGNARLAQVYEYRRRLAALWERTAASNEHLLEDFKRWCAEAEASGVEALRDYAQSLRGYALRPAV